MESGVSNAANAAQPVQVEKSPISREPFTPTSDVTENTELARFWTALRRLPKYLKLAANMARDSNVPKTAKAMLGIGGIYTVSPIDLVPGFIPVAGQLDDLFVLLLALRTAIRACPPAVAEAHLQRAGLARTDFDDDLAAAKDTARWLAVKGARGSKRLAADGKRRLGRLWRETIRPR